MNTIEIKGRPKDHSLSNKIRTKLTNIIRSWLFVSFDQEAGMYNYALYGHKIYVKYRKDIVDPAGHEWVCRNIFYKDFYFSKDDVIVDIGAGYGEEAAFLENETKNIKYVGIEIQPSIYECLCSTLGALNKQKNNKYVASSIAISKEKSVFISSGYKYSRVNGDETDNSVVEVLSKNWSQILKFYNIDKIDLFKMNIEGAEVDVLECIDDFSIIKRFAIACHDFRSEKGESDYFRTKSRVVSKLESLNYLVLQPHYGIKGFEWADDWIYAEQKDTVN